MLEIEPINYRHPLIQAWHGNEKWIKDRLIITPHAAFYNIDSYLEMRRKAAEELKRIISDQKPNNCVN